MNHFNSENYESTIKSLLSIKTEIANSKHDRMSVDEYSDFEPSKEEVDSWLNQLNLPAPSDAKYSIVYELPREYWKNIFGEPDGENLSNEEEAEVRNNTKYLELFNIYACVFEDLYEAAKEESAYYANEFEEESKYHDSMRGRI
jgi:hypothetical protein